MIKIRHILIFNDASAFSVRFLHERHEQTKQDLKGLEETVVSKTITTSLLHISHHPQMSTYLTSSPSVCHPGSRTPDPPQPAQAVRSRPHVAS